MTSSFIEAEYEQKLKAPTQNQEAILKRWRLSTFFVVLVGYIGYYLCRGNLSAALPLLSRTFGYSNTQLSFILSISELAYAAGKLINGPLADRVGGKNIFICGMVGALLANLLFSQLEGLIGFTIVWCFCRYFLSMGWGGLIKVIGAWFPQEKNGTIMGFVSINFQMGGGVALLYSGFILSLGYSWQALFIIPALTLGLIAFVSIFASRNHPHQVFPNVRFGESASKKTSLMGWEKEDKALSPKVIFLGLLKKPIFC